MIPLLVLGTLLGVGYTLSKQNDEHDAVDTFARSLPPSEQARVGEAAIAARAHGPGIKPKIGSVVYSDLRGKAVPVEDMTHGNMQPHYRGKSAPGSNPLPNVLSKLNGSLDASTHIPKREQAGAQPVVRRTAPRQREETEFQQGRYSDGITHKMEGERPFAQINVGPGLDSGYSSNATGGYQQYNVQTNAMPATVDQLRTGFNSTVRIGASDTQRAQYGGRVTGGASPAVPMRAEKPQSIQMQKAPTAFARSMETMLPTGGGTLKAPIHGDSLAAPTRRGVRSDTVGIAGVGDTRAGGYSVEQPWLRATQPGLAGPNPGVVTRAVGAKPLQTPLAYADVLRDQERDHSSLAQALGGAAPAAGGMSQRDIPQGSRESRHVLTSATPHLYGQFQTSTPPKSTVYDANDVMRTTIKETTIHDMRTGVAAPRQPTHGITRDPDAQAPQATIRNTTGDLQGAHGDGRMTGSNVVYKAPVYDPDDVPRTTDKDTLLFERLGNSDAVEASTGYGTAPRDVSLTQKQFISNNPYTGAVSGSGGDAYKVTANDVSHTQRAAMSDNMFTGSAGLTTSKKPANYAQNYARTFNEIREMTLVNRDPNRRGAELSAGTDLMGSGGSTRDPLLDAQRNQQPYQRQGTIQQYKAPTCEAETRTKQPLTLDQTPDPIELASLRDNPYLQKGPQGL
jgi:hypothetical protein